MEKVATITTYVVKVILYLTNIANKWICLSIAWEYYGPSVKELSLQQIWPTVVGVKS